MFASLWVLAGCGSNGHITERNFSPHDDDERRALERMRDLVAQVTPLLDDPRVSQANRTRLEQALDTTRASLSHYSKLRSRGDHRVYVLAAVKTSSAGILADDATGVGVADDVLLLPLALTAVAVYLITDAAASDDELGAAWNDVLERLGDLGRAVDGVAAMVASGNVADTGLMEEVYALLDDLGLSASDRANICRALQMLWESADRSGDRAKKRRIVRTQKYNKCRHSRHSRE